jgi:hypothetical protein
MGIKGKSGAMGNTGPRGKTGEKGHVTPCVHYNIQLFTDVSSCNIIADQTFDITTFVVTALSWGDGSKNINDGLRVTFSIVQTDQTGIRELDSIVLNADMNIISSPWPTTNGHSAKVNKNDTIIITVNVNGDRSPLGVNAYIIGT